MSTNEPWPMADAPDEDFDPEVEYGDIDNDPGELFDLAMERWHAVGRQLRAARLRLGISMREAARRAELSDGAWRHLERGTKLAYGTTVLPNPRPENLIAVAKAVDLNPVVLFEIAGKEIPDDLKFLTYPRASGATTPDGETVSLDGLSDPDLDLVLKLIERLKRPTDRP